MKTIKICSIFLLLLITFLNACADIDDDLEFMRKSIALTNMFGDLAHRLIISLDKGNRNEIRMALNDIDKNIMRLEEKVLELKKTRVTFKKRKEKKKECENFRRQIDLWKDVVLASRAENYDRATSLIKQMF